VVSLPIRTEILHAHFGFGTAKRRHSHILIVSNVELNNSCEPVNCFSRLFGTPTMEQRVSIPPGLPRPQPTVSYWQDPPDPISNLRTTAYLPQHADIVIIGGGITGASTAYHLLARNPSLAIVLLEAREAASGASGRNGRLETLCHSNPAFYAGPALDHGTSLLMLYCTCRGSYERSIIQGLPAQCQVHW